MWAFIGITVALFFGLAFFAGYMRREEVMANWGKYRSDPLYMFAAPLFKPKDDPRSPVKFATDNFSENVMMMIHNVFMVFLEPVFKIFRLFLDSLLQTAEGLFNIKALFANMWDKWNKMVDPFMRRFQTVFHRLRVTYIKLFAAMQKAMAIAVSSVYAGLSTITTMLSFLDLMVNIVIIICITLLVLVFLPPFILLPVIPLIILALVMVGQTASAAGATGMAETFCFAKGTSISTSDGVIPIEKVKNGDVLFTGGSVLGTMKFQKTTHDLYNLYDVIVSGTHIVYRNGNPVHVKDHPDAKPHQGKETELFCLITSDNKIPVLSQRGIELFADWEELESLDDLRLWHKQVHEALNPTIKYDAASESVLYSESVFSGNTRVVTEHGLRDIKDIRPGECVLDEHGYATIVEGIVELHKHSVHNAVSLEDGAYISSAVWFYEQGVWKQSTKTPAYPKNVEKWYSLFTKSGTFRIQTSDAVLSVRDFTDIGPDRLHETYDWVLESLRKQKKCTK